LKDVCKLELLPQMTELAQSELPQNLGVPVEVRRVEQPTSGLQIFWSSGIQRILSGDILRLNCPCAECLEQRGALNHSKPLAAASTATLGRGKLNVVRATKDESTRIEQVWAVGNYAIGIRWADTHDSGIYSYELLKQLTSLSTG
jgi:ATP-binding protein involved in chromosome partitioning